MENSTYLLSSSLYGQESVRLMSAGVAGSPTLLVGLLLGYTTLGLVSYMCAFRSQRNRLKAFKEAISLSCSCEQGRLRGVQHIHNGLVILIFMDVVNAITAIILGIAVSDFCSSKLTCVYVLLVWFLSRSFGLNLHFLNALVCLLFLRKPQWGARLHKVHTSVILMIVAYVFVFVFLGSAATFILSFLPITLFIAIIVIGTMSTASPSASVWKKLIVFVATMTFLIVYAPSFILQWLVVSAEEKYLIIWMNVLFGTHFQIFMNGLLCYFILKLPSEEEERQQEQQQRQESFANSNYGNSSTYPTGSIPNVHFSSNTPEGPQGDPRAVEMGNPIGVFSAYPGPPASLTDPEEPPQPDSKA